jgi:hypothetical protein
VKALGVPALVIVGALCKETAVVAPVLLLGLGALVATAKAKPLAFSQLADSDRRAHPSCRGAGSGVALDWSPSRAEPEPTDRDGTTVTAPLTASPVAGSEGHTTAIASLSGSQAGIMPGPDSELPTARGLACPVGPGPQLYTGSSQQPPRGELGHSHPGSEATSGSTGSHAGTGSSRASLRRMWLWVCPILWRWAPYFLAVVFFQVAILLIRMTVVSSGCVDRASLSGGAAKSHDLRLAPCSCLHFV